MTATITKNFQNLKKMYNVGDVIEISHGKWTEKYIVIFVCSWGEVHLKKVRLGRTKISFLRFPETIFLRQTAQSKIDSIKKVSKLKK